MKKILRAQSCQALAFLASFGGLLVAGGSVFAGDSIRPVTPVAVYKTGEAVRMFVDSPSSAVHAPKKVSWIVRDWKNRVRLEDAVNVPADSKEGITIGLKDLPSGWYSAEFKVDVQPAGTQKFVIGSYYKSRGETFRYGMCAHLPSLKATEREKANELLKSLGVDIARVEVPWAGVQRGKDGPFKFDRYDSVIDELQKLGVEPALLLDYGVPWASTAPTGASDTDLYRYAPQIEPWLGYVRAVYGQYGKKTKYWEIWNEPDISFWKSPVEQYLELFRRTSAELAQLDPRAQIMNGGFAMVSRQPNPDFMPRFVAGADRSHWSLFAWHDYMTLAESRERIATAKALMKASGFSLPLWMNEGGFHTFGGGREAMQPVLLVKKIAHAAAAGVHAYFWYSLWDAPSLAHDPEGYFGLATGDFQPKPAYAAYRELISRLADRPAQTPAVSDAEGFYALGFGPRKSGGGSGGVTVIWRETPGPDEPVWIGSASATDRLHFSDLMGASKGGELIGGGIAFVGEDPGYAESAEGKPVSVKRILKLPARVAIRSGEAGRIAIPLTNPLSGKAEITAELGWRGNNGSFTAVAPSWQATLETGASKSIEFLPDANLFSKLAKAPGGGELSVRFGKNAVPQRIALAIENPQRIGLSANAWKQTLADRSFIRNLHEAEPDESMHWGGPNDLSAQVSTTWDPQSKRMQIVVEARDDQHDQKFESAALWKGDSLQIAFALMDKPAESFEFSFGLPVSGKPDAWLSRVPSGSAMKVGPVPAEITYSISRSKDVTRYEIELPAERLGICENEPFLMNFLVNDSDGHARKQWLQLTPGLGENKDCRLFRSFLLESH